MKLPFARLWIGATASGLATWALPFVLGFLVLDGTLSAGQLGVVLAIRTVGFLLAVPVAGVLADLGGRRRIVLAASVIAAHGVALIVYALHSGNAADMALLVAGAAIAGAGQGACRPAYQALVPSVVPTEKLQGANAAMSLSLRTSTLVGPTLASLAASAFGPSSVMIGILLLWIISALLPPWPAETMLSGTVKAQGIATLFLESIAEGLSEARRHPWFIAGLAALTTVIATGYSVTSVLVPSLSQTNYGGSILLVSTATAYTLGAVVGAVLLAKWRPQKRGWWALAGLGAYGLVPLSLLVPQFLIVPVGAFFFAGIGIEFFNIAWFTAVQREMRPDKLARVSAIDFLLSYGLAPVGLALIAPLAQVLGTPTLLILSSLLCVVAAIAASTVGSSRQFSNLTAGTKS